MPLDYEFHDDANLPGLARLWAEGTDWGADTLTQLQRWFASAPFGPPCIVAARDTDSGEIVGQFRFLPTQVMVDGVAHRAVRPFGTIVSPAASRAVRSIDPMAQPAVAMFLRGASEMKARGAQFTHMSPDPHWVGLFRRFPTLQYTLFPFWTIALPLQTSPSLGDGYTLSLNPAWDERVDRLWERSARLYGCSLVRDSRVLRWKAGTGEYQVVAVERDGELAGLVAGARKNGPQWLICDLLCADNEGALRATLAATLQVAHERSRAADPSDPHEGIRKAGILATPAMQPALQSLGFTMDASYRFPLAVQVLDEALDRATIAPERWYASAND